VRGEAPYGCALRGVHDHQRRPAGEADVGQAVAIDRLHGSLDPGQRNPRGGAIGRGKDPGGAYEEVALVLDQVIESCEEFVLPVSGAQCVNVCFGLPLDEEGLLEQAELLRQEERVVRMLWAHAAARQRQLLMNAPLATANFQVAASSGPPMVAESGRQLTEYQTLARTAERMVREKEEQWVRLEEAWFSVLLLRALAPLEEEPASSINREERR
jgi:hypothetical protein